MIPETSNPAIDTRSIGQPDPCDPKTAAQAELDLMLKEMLELKTEQELRARAIGLLVKKIIEERTWEKAGDESAEDCFRKRFKRVGSRATLYNWKAIAERFSDDEVRQFGTSTLLEILTHEASTGERLPDENRGEHEIRLTQKDGSEVVKKLKDCSSYELRRSNNTRRKLASAPATKLITEKPGMLRKAVLAGAGAVMLVVADLLPPSWLSAVSALVGASLLFAGGNYLVRRGLKWLQSFIHSGQALELLASVPAKLLALSRSVVQGAHRLWSFIRSGQVIHAMAKLPSTVMSLGRKAVAGLKHLPSLLRGIHITERLSRVASKLPSLRRKQDRAVPPAKAQTPIPVTGRLTPPSAT